MSLLHRFLSIGCIVTSGQGPWDFQWQGGGWEEKRDDPQPSHCSPHSLKRGEPHFWFHPLPPPPLPFLTQAIEMAGRILVDKVFCKKTLTSDRRSLLSKRSWLPFQGRPIVCLNHELATGLPEFFCLLKDVLRDGGIQLVHNDQDVEFRP